MLSAIYPFSDNIGKVEYVDHMGSDLSVVNAARVSMDKSHTTFDDEGDTKLINYLAAHNHWTPFGHAHLSLRVKAPIFVARQLVKHQVGLVWNEVSRRYVSSPPEIYRGYFTGKAANVKQGSTGERHPNSAIYEADRDHIYVQTVNLYNRMIEDGVAPEDAREILPLDLYTEWIWSGSLAAWARICNLRIDSHAQRHVQVYGRAFDEFLKARFPVSRNALIKE